MAEKKNVRLEICGLVQGVGMRHYVYNCAQKLGVKGYVKNLPNGRVECVAEGNEEQLKNLHSMVERCPRGRVEEVYASEISPGEKFSDFSIRF